MADDKRIAVVTGANRGMGLETCRQLAVRGMRVVLTSRDRSKGEAAVAALAADGAEVSFHVLDVTDGDSIAALHEHLQEEHGRLDVLVNNAGVALDPLDDEHSSIFDGDPEIVRRSFDVNAVGAMRVSQALVPLMRDRGYGRVVNVSSGMGGLTEMNGRYPGYRMSKAALNAVTRIFADELSGTNIKVNSVCPGHVSTDMGGPDAPRSVDEGVDTTIWLATLRDDGPSGGFFRDCKAISW
jgi:NAD(P)-dependent dehydrogenase (short-subunit alcohol dehydrogenase family)